MKQPKTRTVAEFGDFQTPPPLALAATKLLRALGVQPTSIIEPTCGKGAFLEAAALCFPEAKNIIGVDINAEHLGKAADNDVIKQSRVRLQQGDFFKVDWSSIITKAHEPWLIIGNPPWVTSSELGSIASANLPEKSNFHGRQGIEAIMGKSNFDISEWMLLRYLDWFKGGAGMIAVLCKTAVARKVLLHIWQKKIPLQHARILKINAIEHFGASVDACFFVVQLEPNARDIVGCGVYDSLEAETPSYTIGFTDGYVISDLEKFSRYRELLSPEKHYIWRSGIKHVCSKVMELRPATGGYENGLGEVVDLEDEILYPMLKSSDVGNNRLHCRGVMIVTQESVGQETASIALRAPKTWQYLQRHADLLNARSSTIYKNKPPFSIFGIGAYSLAPWKIAISGFYKRLQFLKIGPVDKRPVVLDDTISFLPCWSEKEADFLEALLTSEPARDFYHSMIHWDEKRPITADILKRLSVKKLATLLGRESDYTGFVSTGQTNLFATQLPLDLPMRKIG